MSIKKFLCLLISILSIMTVVQATNVFAASVVNYPSFPNAVKSPLYTVTANGTPLFVEKLTKFSPEMQVHYAHCSLSGTGTANFTVTCNESFNSYKLSPKSRNLSASKNGNTVSFASGPNYLVFQPDSKELLFIFIDSEEVNPPKLGDSNVKNILDYGVDNTGATLATSKIQSAINAASGATRNILYFPAGRYKIGELWMKSNMTLYLAGGAILYGSDNPSDFNTGSGGVNIEGCSHGVIRMYKINNAKILGRGVIDGNGKLIRSKNDTKINLMKIEESSNILVDGVIVRDSSFWNTLPYRSDKVTIKNYKMINCVPKTSYNNTDGVDFDECTNGYLYNAFLYTGDDSCAVKTEYNNSGTINTKNIVHEKIVMYSGSAGCKIGTKTMGKTMDGIVFKDIDVVKVGRALVIDAYDTAVISNSKFENVRIEEAGSLVNLEEADPPSWRTCANQCIIKDAYFTNIYSYTKKSINLRGKSSTYNINGVHFSNFKVMGNPITSKTDTDASWNINSYVSNITFSSIAPTPTNTPSTPTPIPTQRSAFTTIEAESFNTQSGIQTETCGEGGEDIGYIENGDYAVYNNINFGTGAGSFQARVSGNGSGGNIEIRLDSISGPLVGTCPVTATGDWQTWTDAMCNVSGANGTHDLYLKFTGESSYLFNLNWWKFSAASSPTPTSVGIKGDLNSDGSVNSIDMAACRMHLLGITQLTGTKLSNADVNGDGQVNSIDFALMRQYVLGMIASFPG